MISLNSARSYIGKLVNIHLTDNSTIACVTIDKINVTRNNFFLSCRAKNQASQTIDKYHVQFIEPINDFLMEQSTR